EVDTPFEEVLRIAAESPYTRLPVYEESLDRIIGMIHIRDLASRALNGPRPEIRELIRSVAFVPEGLTAERVLERLRDEKQHMAIVVDEFGGTAGLVTVGDVLDEIFGGLADEFKIEEAVPERLADGRVRLPGSMRLDEAATWIGVEWEGDVHTVGGMVVERLGRFPEPGERVVIDGVPVEVERVSKAVIDTVLAGPVEGVEDEGDA